MSQAAGKLLTGLPAGEVAKIVATSLRALGFESLFVNEQYRTITAGRKEPFRTANFNAVLDYAVTIEWSDYSDDKGPGMLIETKVVERMASWSSSNCQQKVDEIEDVITKYARQVDTGAGKAKITGARWATVNELSLAGYLGDMESDQLLLGYLDGKYLRLPELETNRHCLVCGPTGSGKTTGIFIPNLIERPGASAIVTEATGGKGVADLYRKTAGYRKSQGHRIYYFNPDDLASNRINPLDRVRTFRDAWRVVETIMLATTLSQAKLEQTWDTAERLLFAALIMHAVGERPAGNCNLGYILDLLGEGTEAVSVVMAQTKVPPARRFYRAFWTNSTDKYRNLVAAGLLSRLALWNQPRIKELTSRTDVDVSRLATELFTWYIAVPADKPELKPLASLIFNLALSYVYEGDFSNPVMLLLDEFTNFGYIRSLPQKLTILRHDKIPVILGVQDLVQIESLYGKDATILRNQCATRVYFKPNGSETAQVISRDLGMYTKEETTVTSAGQLHTRTEKLPLMSADEILNMGVIDEATYSNAEVLRPQILLALPSTRPIKIEACYFKDYLDQTNCPVPESEGKEVEVQEDLMPQPVKLLVKETEKLEAILEATIESADSTDPIQYPAMWYEPIVIIWPVGESFEKRIYKPDSSLLRLEELMTIYEAGDERVTKSMTPLEAAKLAAWLERRAELDAASERERFESKASEPAVASELKSDPVSEVVEQEALPVSAPLADIQQSLPEEEEEQEGGRLDLGLLWG